MTNEEIVASFMEPVPGFRGIDLPYSVLGFWVKDLGQYEKAAAPLTLDRLRLVQERLDLEQWLRYAEIIYESSPDDGPAAPILYLHASAEQKLAALAEVLRPVVEKAKDPKAEAEVKA